MGITTAFLNRFPMLSKKEIKALMLDFIRRQKIAVISTVSPENKPEAAVIEFGQTDELELIFDTFNYYRKYKNISQNPQVAFAIGWDDNITVQYEGEAEELSGDRLQQYKTYYFQKNPRAQRWETREGICYFRVKPAWIRYSDLTSDPWKIYELDDFSSVV